MLLDSLMGPLQIINDIEHFIHHLSKSKIIRLAISLKSLNPKINVPLSYIFLHLCACFWVKIQNNEHYRNSALFEIWQIDT